MNQQPLSNKHSLLDIYLGLYARFKPFLIAHPKFDFITRTVRRNILDRVLPPDALARNMANPLMYDGMRLHYRPMDKGDMNIALSIMRGGYESETVAEVNRILAPGKTFLDLGAHIGFFSLLAAKRVGPGGRVYAFEPDPETIRVLNKNIIDNNAEAIIRIVPMAVTSQAQVRSLFRLKDHSDSSSLYPRLRDQDSVQIQSISLDLFIEKEGWPGVQLIKMDVEGAESNVLEGMRELFFRNPRLTLITEINLNRIQNANGSLEGLIGDIMGSGFSSLRVLYPGWGRIDPAKDVQKLHSLALQYNVNLLCECPQAPK